MINNDNFDEIVLNKLIQSFYKGSLKFHLQPEEIEILTWVRQQHFLDATVNSDAVKKYPVNVEFSRLFFKKLIAYLEPTQEVHDEFYTYLCSVMKIQSEKNDFCYRHYVIGNDLNNKIIIKETNKMVVNGTTGMRTWEAALMISDWALCNQKVFYNKKVLELGSGIGFTGITIAKKCDPDSIMLTDCHTDVLRAVCDNIKINFPDITQKETQSESIFSNKEKTLGVMMLDWNCLEDLPNHIVPDILIGADIIYDPTIISPLCNTIKTFFDRNAKLEVYIANIIRNEDTYKQFLKTLGSLNLPCEEISQSKSVLIEWDYEIKRCLLKIKLE